MEKPIIMPVQKLKNLIGLGVIDEEALQEYEVSTFMSKNDMEMLSLKKGKTDISGNENATKETLSQKALQTLASAGLFRRDRINSGDLILDNYESSYEGAGKMVSIQIPTTAASLDDLLCEDLNAGIEASEDNEMDFDTDSF